MAADTTLKPESTVVAGEHFIHFAPVGTTLPTDSPAIDGDPGDGIDAAFLFAGATADTGAAWTIDAQVTDLYSSQLLDVYRQIVQSKKATLTAPLIDWTGGALTTATGGGTISATANGAKLVPPPQGVIEEMSAVVTIRDGGHFTRLVCERGLVAGSMTIPLVKTGFSTLPITYTALAAVEAEAAWVLYSTNPALLEGLGS